MVEPSSFYTRLASRSGFNSSVRHITRTLELLDTCGAKKNLADEINGMLAEKNFDEDEIQAAVNMLLVEKWKYRAVARNVSSVTSDATNVAREVSRWKAVDLVVGYHHPDLGFIVVNPKNPESAAVIAGFRKNELVVVYAGTANDGIVAERNARDAISILFSLIEGSKAAKAPSSLVPGPFAFVPPKKPTVKRAVSAKPRMQRTPRAAAADRQSVAAAPAVVPESAMRTPPPAAAPAVPGRSKMSGLVSVVVTNELFHNGNVEAWKRIIRSYNAKYPNLQVIVYYDGERIVDINTLFKWGKVKHGSCIQFAVSGEDIQDLAKLSRYFRQGASPQFEAFLRGSPDTVMTLF